MTSERELVGKELDELIRRVSEQSGTAPVFVVRVPNGNYERHVHSITQRAIIDPPGWVKAAVVLLAVNLVVCSVLLVRSFSAPPAPASPDATQLTEIHQLTKEARDFALQAKNDAFYANRRATSISRHLGLERNPQGGRTPTEEGEPK